ncbi:hypothetical protein PJL18_03534 [Paenarthrobacter nicotinovorans]|nr:hypothetical protein [Paenarthrobacter nicotinovorans]
MNGHRGPGVGNCPHDVVTLNVRVLLDLMRDLEGEQRETDAAVVGSGGKPVHLMTARQEPAIGAAPEPDVVAFAGVVVHFLLIGEILLPVEQVERADRRLGIALPENGGADDAAAAAEGDVVRLRPAGSAHDGVDLRLVAEQRDVHGIAQESVTGPGAPDEVARNVNSGQDAVQAGQEQISKKCPEEEVEPHLAPTQVETLPHQQERQPHRSRPAQDEERMVQPAVSHVPARRLVHREPPLLASSFGPRAGDVQIPFRFSRGC